MSKLPILPNKQKACFRKASFRTVALANKIAEKHDQRVYECPICFCFHLTSNHDWRDDFISVEDIPKYANQMAHKFISENSQKYKEKIKSLNIKIDTMNKEISKMRKEIKNDTNANQEH